jgi:hypothetical protein
MNNTLRIAQRSQVPSEHQIQAAFFTRLALSPWHDYPIYAIPNFAGHHGSAQARLISGARAKAEGRRKGVPDICAAVPRAGWPGLYLEAKKPGNHPDAEQRVWIARLQAEGYAVGVCWSTDELWAALQHYLTGAWSATDQWSGGRYQPSWPRTPAPGGPRGR